MGIGLKVLMYMLSIILPIVILAIEYKGINFTEILYGTLGHIFLGIGNTKQAKNFFIIQLIYDRMSQ